MADTQKFIAGWNLPGCLPEVEPADFSSQIRIFDSEEEAIEFIKEEMRFVSGPDLIGPNDPYVYWVEPLLEDA
jgi:hypothetical protein